MLCYIFLISNKLAYTTSFKVPDDYYSFNSSLKTATRRSFKGVYLNYFSKPLPITKKKQIFMLELNHNDRHGKWKSIREMSEILLLSNGSSKNFTETEIPNSISYFLRHF